MAVLLSAVVALTLSRCWHRACRFAYTGRPRNEPERHRRADIRPFRPLPPVPLRMSRRAAHCSCRFGTFRRGLIASFGLIRQELTPIEDRSLVLLRVYGTAGRQVWTIQRSRCAQSKGWFSRCANRARSQDTFASARQDGSTNNGFMVMALAPWHKRERSQQQIVAEISQLALQVPGVRAFPVQPNSLGIRGAGSGLQFAIVGNNYAQLSGTPRRSSQRWRKIRASTSRACRRTAPAAVGRHRRP